MHNIYLVKAMIAKTYPLKNKKQKSYERCSFGRNANL